MICWFSAWLHMHVSSYHGYMCDLLALNVQIACILWSPTSLVPGFNNSWLGYLPFDWHFVQYHALQCNKIHIRRSEG